MHLVVVNTTSQPCWMRAPIALYGKLIWAATDSVISSEEFCKSEINYHLNEWQLQGAGQRRGKLQN